MRLLSVLICMFMISGAAHADTANKVLPCHHNPDFVPLARNLFKRLVNVYGSHLDKKKFEPYEKNAEALIEDFLLNEQINLRRNIIHLQEKYKMDVELALELAERFVIEDFTRAVMGFAEWAPADVERGMRSRKSDLIEDFVYHAYRKGVMPCGQIIFLDPEDLENAIEASVQPISLECDQAG